MKTLPNLHDLLLILTDAALKAAVVLLAAWIVTLCMRRASAAARHLLWVQAIIIAMLLPIASALLPAYRLALLPPQGSVAVPTGSASRVLAPSQHRSEPSHEDGSVIPPPQDRSRVVTIEPRPVSSLPASSLLSALEPNGTAPANDIPAIVLTVWLAGVAMILTGGVIGHYAAWRLARRTPKVGRGAVFEAVQSVRKTLRIRWPVGVRMGSTVTMPIASGFVHPNILLPDAASQWSSDQLGSVLLHEIAHVKRLDCATQCLAQISCAIYWFNPLVWLAAARIRTERERACDDLVLLLGPAADMYAEHLMDIAHAMRGNQSILNIGALAMARPSGLRSRVTDILDRSIYRRALSWRLTLIAAIMAAAILLPLSVVRLGNRQSARAAPPPVAAPATQPEAQQSKVLQLTVLDQSSGQPIEGAKIDAFDGRPGHATTDELGHADIDFSLSQHPALTVQAPNHVAKMLNWASQRTKETPPATYTIQLETPTTIGGKVLLDAGQPIAGATVVIQVDGDTLPDPHERTWVSYKSTKSGSDGSWTFDGIPKHFKACDVGVWDFRYVINDGGDGFFPMQPYQAVADLMSHHAVLTLARGVAVTGTVIGPDGDPVENASVGFGTDRVASNAIPAFKTTDDGRFAFAFKPGTPLVLTATASGDAPELVKLVVAPDKNDVTIKLQSGRTMEGHVLDPSGKPLADAYVWLDTWRGCRTLGDETLRTDRNGHFKWADAPVDTVYADIESPGFMRSNKVPLTAGAINDVKLQRPLHVSGTVTDAVTGKPIPTFKLLHGTDSGNGPLTHFDVKEMEIMHGGTFDYTEAWPRPGYALRAQADGYVPAETRVFKAEEGSVHFDLKLQPATPWKPMVLLPDGSLAVGAKAVLLLPGEGSFSFNGQMDDGAYDHEHERFTTGTDGTLSLPLQSGRAKVFVFVDSGCASADQDALKRNDPIRIQPWAGIHGRLMIGSQPGADQKMGLLTRLPEGTVYDPENPQLQMYLDIYTKTGPDGSFAFDRLPPGAMVVGRYVEQGHGGQYAATEKVTLQPGKTVTVQVGGNGRAVEGKVVLPQELTTGPQQDWGLGGNMQNHVDYPKMTIPDEVKTMTSEQKKKWYGDWAKSDAGKQFYAAQLRAVQSIREFAVEMKPDHTFRIEDVPAGQYDLSFSAAPASSTGGEQFSTASATVTVPDMPGGRDDHPLELPNVVLQMTKHK